VISSNLQASLVIPSHALVGVDMLTSFTWALEFKLNVRHEDTAPQKGFASPSYQLAGGSCVKKA